MSQNQDHTPPDAGEKIDPVAFRTKTRGSVKSSRPSFKWAAGALLAAVLALLAAVAGFVFTARQVVLTVTPAPDRIAVRGGLMAPRLGGRYLLRPGDYVVHAEKKCFAELAAPFTVGEAGSQTFAFRLEPLPGRLSLRAHPEGDPGGEIAGARVLVNDREIGRTPLKDREVPAGIVRLEVRADRYLVYTDNVSITGCATEQTLTVTLTPGWAPVSVDSVPPGAAVRVDGESMGTTPAALELGAGSHRLVLGAEGWKPWEKKIEVEAHRPLNLGKVRLEPADGRLAVASVPGGATVTVGGQYAGQTPLEVLLAPGEEHEIRISKAGHETARRRVVLGRAEKKALGVELQPRLGEIQFVVRPEDAELILNGKSMGRVPRKLTLTAVAQTIEIRKPGYRSFATRITPRPGLVQQIDASLEPVAAAGAKAPERTTAANGYPLQPITPQPFTMGSSRREQGRRSNETLRQVRLVRGFYMGIREVSNKEFREFAPEHDSGKFKGRDLNGGELPAVGVTWKEAALFCNWLSAREGLPPVYAVKGDRLLAADPLTAGYRLPTEAEWEYCARFDGRQAARKYPWGDVFPPGDGAGNFADDSAREFFFNRDRRIQRRLPGGGAGGPVQARFPGTLRHGRQCGRMVPRLVFDFHLRCRQGLHGSGRACRRAAAGDPGGELAGRRPWQAAGGVPRLRRYLPGGSGISCVPLCRVEPSAGAVL